jgi:hypothetical protein
MTFIYKNEKTNWKYLFLVFCLGAAVGAGTIWMFNGL